MAHAKTQVRIPLRTFTLWALIALVVLMNIINFTPFCSASPEIIGVKFGNRQTDRQTGRHIFWHHVRGYVDFFLKLNLQPPYSLCLQGHKQEMTWNRRFFVHPKLFPLSLQACVCCKLMRIELRNHEWPFLRLLCSPRLVTITVIVPYSIFEMVDARCIALDL